MKQPLIKFSITLLLPCLLLAITSTAKADILYDNFAAGNGYTTGSGRTLGTSSLWEQGPRFTVSGGDYFLDSVEAAISYVTGVNQVTLTLYDSAGGLPGTALESVTLGGFGNFGDNNPPTSFNFSGSTVLQNGNDYFLVASSNNDGNSWLVFNHNSTGDTGNVFRNSTSGWTWGASTTAGAYRVHGTLVPEPSSFFVVGIVGVALLRRRRK